MSNGPFRRIPNLGNSGDRQQQAKQALMQQLSQMSAAMYMQIVALRLQHAGSPPPDFAEIARQSQEAAKAYFEGLGLAQFERKDQQAP